MSPVPLHVFTLSVFASFPISVVSIHTHLACTFSQHVTLRRANGKPARRQLDFTSQEGEVDRATVSACVRACSCACVCGGICLCKAARLFRVKSYVEILLLNHFCSISLSIYDDARDQESLQ